MPAAELVSQSKIYTWADAQARLWGDSPDMCEEVLALLFDSALNLAAFHVELHVPESEDRARALRLIHEMKSTGGVR